MLKGHVYRITAAVGVGLLTGLAVGVANLPISQRLITTYVPVFWRLDPQPLHGSDILFATVLTMGIVLVCLLPVCKPRPWRILDVIFVAQKRVIVAGLALATLGYFNYSYRLPRATLTMTIGVLVVLIPAWFVWIRQRPSTDAGRAVLIGDDPDQIRGLLARTDLPYVGYLSSSRVFEPADPQRAVTDGGMRARRLGGLSRIGDVFVDHDIDTAVLAFREPDRGEFFGALDACFAHGVTAKVPRQFADSVLSYDQRDAALVDVAVEPWDVQDYVVKRVFDLAFATIGLLLLSPVMVVIAIAIYLDDGTPVVYRQIRTSGFGESFTVHKFRSMTPADASPVPTADHDRITRIGAFLRQTHLDEIPQLWTILLGRMSVVGPRAVWVEEEDLLEADLDTAQWRKRWFVKPGLTGLAQVNDAGSERPHEKLRYDLEYIRTQSFTYDVKLVVRQLWMVWGDVLDTLRGRDREVSP